jgi:hypothetical protein
MYPVIALLGLAVFMWIVAIWATFDESEEHHDAEKPDESAPSKRDHQKAA